MQKSGNANDSESLQNDGGQRRSLSSSRGSPWGTHLSRPQCGPSTRATFLNEDTQLEVRQELTKADFAGVELVLVYRHWLPPARCIN